MDNDVNKTQIQTKNDSDKLPDGVSRFDYNGAKYTIYKKDSEYKSEYFAPDGTEFDDFIKELNQAIDIVVKSELSEEQKKILIYQRMFYR